MTTSLRRNSSSSSSSIHITNTLTTTLNNNSNNNTTTNSSLIQRRSLVERSLITTYEDTSGSFGNFFDIIALADIRLTHFDIHTDLDSFLYFEVYTKRGGYAPCVDELKCWGRTLHKGQISGMGQGNPTPLPPFNRPLNMKTGERRGFYVTLNTPDLRYSNGFVASMVYSEDFFLQILEGAGVGRYPLTEKSHFAPRVWNGAIHYEIDMGPTVSPTMGPSSVPSAMPSAFPSVTVSGGPSAMPSGMPSGMPTGAPTGMPSGSPTGNPSAVRSLRPTIEGMESFEVETTNKGRLEGRGNIFDVVASRKVSITGISFHTKIRRLNITFSLWTKRGTYVGFETNPDVWRMVASGETTGMGTGQFTPIPDGMWSFPVRLDANETQAFYLSTNEEQLLYSMGTNNKADQTPSTPPTDRYIQIPDGAGVSGDPFSEDFFQPRTWNGKIHYMARGDIKQVNTTTDDLSTGAKFTLSGDMTEMENDQTAFFENCTSRLLNQILSASDPPITVTSVSVTGQAVVSQGRVQQSRRKHGFYAVSEPTSSIEISAAITGEYMPPPEVSFGEVVEDSVEKQGADFIEMLKENDHFSKLTGIKVAVYELTEASPTNPPTAINKPKLEECEDFGCKYSGIIYIVVGVVFLLGCGVFALKYSKKMPKNKRNRMSVMDFDGGAFDDDDLNLNG